MKKIIFLSALIGAGWIIYDLFQPIFEYNFGWSTIPEDIYEQKFEGIETSSYKQVINRTKQLVDSIQRKNKMPSISIATMINGKIVWSYAVGYENITEKIPADTSTMYRIGSVSKALTSLGLGLMIQENTIHLDSSLQYYSRRFLDKPRITIRQLASHQSGIRNYGSCLCFPVWEYYRNKSFRSIEESIEDFENDELLFLPGESFSYSSYNYVALSLAMEKASGSNYLDYMDQDIFRSLGMHHTMADQANKSSRAIHYEIDKDYYKKTLDVNLSNKWAGGGFLSSPSDLVRVGNALLDSTLIESRISSLITTTQKLNNGSMNPQGYALGWRHSFSQRYLDGTRDVEVIHHGGMAVGGQALLIVYPEYNMSIAMTINQTGEQGDFRLFDYITPMANEFIKANQLDP